MKTAVIQTGGKQYLVREGDSLKVEKMPAGPDEAIIFDRVLLTSTGKTTKIGTPEVKGASVHAKTVSQGKRSKIFGVKMKAKKRSKKYYGHRQPYTEITIDKIKTS